MILGFITGFLCGAACVVVAALAWLHIEARKDGGRYD